MWTWATMANELEPELRTIGSLLTKEEVVDKVKSEKARLVDLEGKLSTTPEDRMLICDIRHIKTYIGGFYSALYNYEHYSKQRKPLSPPVQLSFF